MGYVFISYNQNHRTEADAVREVLLGKGIQSWMAPYSVAYGENYGGAITRGVRGCDCFLLLLTNASQQSSAVDKEVERAVSYRKPILALQLEDLVLNDSFEYYLSNCQIAFPNKLDENDRAFCDVIRIVRDLCGTDPIVAPAASVEVPVSASAKEKQQSATCTEKKAKTNKTLSKSAEKEPGASWLEMAEFYRNSLGGAENQAKALQYYEKAADLGSGIACYELGECYYDHDCGVERDFEKAAEWYRRGHELGNLDAAFSLANCYRNGEGVEESFPMALMYTVYAAEHGLEMAQVQMGEYYKDGEIYDFCSLERAEYWYKKASESYDQKINDGDTSWANILSLNYGAEGLDDIREKLEERKQATEEGERLFDLAEAYIEGDGVEADEDKGLELLEKAADLGYGLANAYCAMLAWPDDEDNAPFEAFIDSTISAEEGIKMGSPECAMLLATCYATKKGVPADMEKAIAYLVVSADHGQAESQCALGCACEYGEELPEADEKLAIFWYEKAAAQGVEEAKASLERLCDK